MANKKSSMKFGKDVNSEKSGVSLGGTLLRMLGVGVAAGAVLIGSAKKLGDTVLNEENINSNKKGSVREKRNEEK